MDMSIPIGKMPTEVEAEVEEKLLELQRTAVVNMIAEVVETSDIVGQDVNGNTLYLMALSPGNANTLAALFADMSEGGEELGAGGDLDHLDEGGYGEFDEHDDPEY